MNPRILGLDPAEINKKLVVELFLTLKVQRMASALYLDIISSIFGFCVQGSWVYLRRRGVIWCLMWSRSSLFTVSLVTLHSAQT